MLTQIKLTNFKCFKQETTFPLKNFNLFTGVNGSGKSTLLQSLLLMRQSIEYDRYTTRLILNGSYVSLGNFDEVRNREISVSEPIFFEFEFRNPEVFEAKIRYQLISDTDGMSLHIPEIFLSQRGLSEDIVSPKKNKEYDLHYKDEELYQLHCASARSDPHLFRLIKLTPHLFELKEDQIESIPFIQDGKNDISYDYVSEIGFDYFSFDGEKDQDNLKFEKIHFILADRIGPQEFYQKAVLPQFAHVGTKGELTVNVLDKMREALVNEQLCLGEDARNLITQTEGWLGKILNPLKLEIPPSRTNILELFLGGVRPANVGFGYSSVLPIIVSGLIAKPGEKLIIENPEIHLHPKAQSALMQFLVAVANTGVQIFVESHSDHILNATRIAVLKEQLTPQEVSILFFLQGNTQERVNQLPIQGDGRIETWPTGFFDQMDNDLNVLLDI